MTADAFHAALRDDPDDDLTRLVYADWLDEHGDSERARFVRLAVGMEKLSEDDPERGALQERYDDLRLTHGEALLGPRPASVQEVGYRGGLVWSVTFTVNATAADVEGMLVRHPVYEVSLGGERAIKELAFSPVLASIRSLVIRQGAVRKRNACLLERLLGTPAVSNLRQLSVAGDVVDHDLAGVIAGSPGLRELRGLRLERTQLYDGGLKRLLHPGALTKLHSWHVECQAHADVMSEVFSPLRALRWRSLHWPRLAECRSGHLDGLGHCVNLQRLHVTLPWGVRPGPMREWLDRLGQLRELRIDGPFTRALAEELASWPGLARLPRLRLSKQEYAADREAIRRAIRQSPHRERWLPVDFGE